MAPKIKTAPGAKARSKAQPPGRPTKLTPVLQAELVANLVDHCHRSIAARLAGIDPATLRRWMAEGRTNPHGPYGEFCAAILEAESRAERTLIRRIADAAKDDPRNAQWLLTHRYSKRWADRRDDKFEERLRAELLERGKPQIVNPQATVSELRRYADEIEQNERESAGKESILDERFL